MNVDPARLDRLLDDAGLDAVILLDHISVEHATGHRTWVTREMREYMVDPAGTFDFVWPPMALLARGGAAVIVAPAWFAADEASPQLADAFLYQAPTYVVDPEQFRRPVATAWQQRLSALIDRSRQHGSPVEALAAAIRDTGVDLRRVGIEGLGCAPRLLKAIHQELRADVPLTEATSLVRRLRAVKTADELDRLRKAAQIAEEAGGRVLRSIASGLPINSALAQYRSGITERGADVEHFMFSECGLAFSTGRGPARVVENEAVAVDWGCSWEGYRSDTGHTVVVGQVDGLILELHAALAECIEYGASLLRPGVDPVSVSLDMNAALEARGIHGANPHGHGIGLDLRDLPIAMRTPSARPSRSDDLRAPLLEKDMVVNLEATLLYPPHGAVEVERTFVVGAGGGVPLIEQPRTSPVTV